jgi:hypothetical protein
MARTVMLNSFSIQSGCGRAAEAWTQKQVQGDGEASDPPLDSDPARAI